MKHWARQWDKNPIWEQRRQFPCILYDAEHTYINIPYIIKDYNKHP